MARARGSNFQMNVAFESVYGTAPASGYRTMPLASHNLGAAQPLIENELLGFGRDPLAPIRDAVTVEGPVSVPIDVENIGVWLRAALGAPVTTGTGPYVHTFESGAATLPSLAIEMGYPDVPHYAMNTGVRVDRMRWQMERRGQLRMDLDLIAQGEATDDTSGAGTPTAYDMTRFGHFNGAIRRDGVALGNITSAQWTYANSLDRVETIRSDGRIDGLDPGVAMLSGQITGRFADTTLLDQAVDGATCELECRYVLSASASLIFTAPAVHLPRPKVGVSGPSGVEMSFDWQAALDGSDPMLTVVLTNSVASY